MWNKTGGDGIVPVESQLIGNGDIILDVPHCHSLELACLYLTSNILEL